MAAIFQTHVGHTLFFSINHLRKKDVNEPCYKTTELKWIAVNKKQKILGNILTILYMFAQKSTVNLTKSTTKVPTHDAYTVLLVLKLGLIVVFTVINTITHQVFRSLYKTTTVTILN